MPNQLLLGAAIPFLIGAILYALRRFRASPAMLIVFPLLMAAGALWAVAPDLPRLLGCHDLYMRLMFDPRCDIFFWHYTIDQHEFYSPWFMVGWVAILLGLIAAALRELRLTEET